MPLVLLLLGLILIGGGLLFNKLSVFSSEPKIEILGESTEEGENVAEKGKLVVEIAGEVIKPGVYELVSGSRINDLLIIAGGLSLNADRDWVAKNLNLAQRLNDGVKIFIPKVSANRSFSSVLSDEKAVGNKINLNTASLSELDSLWGIGPATAQKIINGRPYDRPEILLEKGIVKKNVWEEIKDKVSVY